jgi:hypothetical protein
VLHPFQAKPAFDGGHGVQNALFQLVDGAGQGGNKVWNHGLYFGLNLAVAAGWMILHLGSAWLNFKGVVVNEWLAAWATP